VTKVVITAAGKGTRLLPFTKEVPKEMMPIFSNVFTNKRIVLPLLQYVYEQLYSMSFRDYCFIVRKEKRSIEAHFTPNESHLKGLNGDYKKVMTNSIIMYHKENYENSFFYSRIHSRNGKCCT